MPDENPYAPSVTTLASSPPPLRPGGYHREGDLLLIRDGTVLPARCIKTNQPITARDWTRAAKIHWTPPWVWVLLLLSPLVALIVAAILQKKATLTYSLSRPVRSGYLKKSAFSLALFFFGVLLLIYSIGSDNPTLQMPGIVTAILMLVVGLVLLVVLGKAIAVKRHQDGWFAIKGCSPEFLASLE